MTLKDGYISLPINTIVLSITNREFKLPDEYIITKNNNNWHQINKGKLSKKQRRK